MNSSPLAPLGNPDDSIGVACPIRMRDLGHGLMEDAPLSSCQSPLCGLRRFVSLARKPSTWLDVSRRKLIYGDLGLELSEKDFMLVATVAAAGGQFVSFEYLAATFGYDERPDPVAALVERIERVRAMLWSVGIPGDLLEIDLYAGVRLSDAGVISAIPTQ